MTDTEILKQYNLHENIALKPLLYSTEEEWHKLRRGGIGGSDVGAVLGLNEYMSPLQVYKSKVDAVVKEVDNVYVKKGHDLESVIREKYVVPELASKGYKVLPVEHTLVNNSYPWLRANLDGIAIPKEGDYSNNIVIEIKWVSEYGETKWDSERSICGIPPSYYAQVQMYMLVTGTKFAIVCALFDRTWEMKYYKIRRDVEFMEKMISKTKTFWTLNVEMRMPPIYSATLDKADIAEDIKKEVVIVEDESMNYDVAQYKRLTKDLKNLEKEVNTMKDIIVTKFMEGKRPTSPLCKVSISTYTTKRFDSAKFKEDHPDEYNNYVKENTVTKIDIK